MTAKRVLLLGAETDLGRAVSEALAESGVRLALVAATSDAEAAFNVQRLARRIGAPVSQAIDATNEAAVRVMVRQVSKALGGLDATVVSLDDRFVREIIESYARREMKRSGGGIFLDATQTPDIVAAVAGPSL